MAFKEVTLTPEEEKAGQKRFENFNAIGDVVTGVLVQVRSVTKTFDPREGPKTFDAYSFYGPKRGDANAPLNFEISPLPYDLERKIKKAMRPIAEGGFGLQEGMCHLVQMKFTGTKAIEGQTNPMKIISLAVDTDFKPQKPLPSDVIWAKAKPAQVTPVETPPPAPVDDDDIPF